MPELSPASIARLATCDERLQLIFKIVGSVYPCVVTQGHRGQAEQDAAFAAGHSKLRWPNGNHNSKPSRAVDAAPTPIDWKDAARFHRFAFFVLGVGHALGIRLRWGGGWDDNRDGDVGDLNPPKSFNDLPHFELVD